MNGIRQVSVQDVLHARDERVNRQRAWTEKYALPLISFTMNIAGDVKVNDNILRAFEEGVQRIQRELDRLHVRVMESSKHTLFTGCEGLWAVEYDAQKLKDSMCRLEEMDALGRLFDIDVLDEKGVHLQREKERVCLICGKPVRGCARTRTHTASQLFAKTMEIIDAHFARKFIRQTGEWAQKALLYEAVTTPKPGLVDCENSGAHRDMDIFSFVNSACALRPYFEECARLGTADAGADALQHLGMQAEETMLSSAGVNTHKGAIFALGILCYARGKCGEQGTLDDVLQVSSQLGTCYLACMQKSNPEKTGGEKQYAKWGLTGARGEAASGFRTAKTVALPAFERALQDGKSINDAGLCALMHLMGTVQDSNVIRRCGKETQVWLMNEGRKCAQEGFTHQQLRELNDAFVARNASPGGSADMLAVTYFLHFLCSDANKQ